MTQTFDTLHCGHITKYEIMESINDSEWQIFRKSLKGTTIADKYFYLQQWLQQHNYTRTANVQVTNYINALKRGGLIK